MRTTFLYWRLAAYRASGKAVIAVVLSIAQALNGMNWSDFTPTQKFVAVALGLAAGWAVIDAFADQTLSEIRRHRGLAIPDDTEIIKRKEVAASVTDTLQPGP